MKNKNTTPSLAIQLIELRALLDDFAVPSYTEDESRKLTLVERVKLLCDETHSVNTAIDAASPR